MDYLELANYAVKEAQSRGAAASEAYLLDADSLTIEVSENQLEMLKLAKDTGIGLRIISKTGAVGFAYSTVIETDEIKQLAVQALDNSRKSFADSHHNLPRPATERPFIELLDPRLSATPVEEKILLAHRAEAAAKQFDSRITKAERCLYQDAQYGVALANSNGLSKYYRAGYCGLYSSVLAAQQSDIQSGMALSYKRYINELNPEAVGCEAARQAMLLLGAKSISPARTTVILSPYVAANFLSVLVPSFSADFVQKGKSMLQGKLGEKVISANLSIIDDGTLNNGIATAPIDGEGVPTQRTQLVDRGVVKSYLYNSYTAARDGARSTGNGIRNSFKSVTDVGPTNVFIEAGDKDPETLVSELDNGFYITSVMGLHTANPISGDFSLGASGVWIRDGRFAHAVRGIAIAGNILELFSKVEAVGSDLQFFGSQGCPSLKISDITVSA